MEGFHRAGTERVNVFRIEDTYLFKHYFEGQEVFDRLKEYYNNQQYRFEVPAEEFEAVQDFLSQHGYGLATVDPVEEFAVVIQKYTAHPDGIFKNSVMHRSVNGYNCFLMTDQNAVEEAVADGGTRLVDSEFDMPF